MIMFETASEEDIALTLTLDYSKLQEYTEQFMIGHAASFKRMKDLDIRKLFSQENIIEPSRLATLRCISAFLRMPDPVANQKYYVRRMMCNE